MTEQEWNASKDPVAMLDWLVQHHKPSDRKLRLAMCAMTRSVHPDHHEDCQDILRRVGLAERWIEGEIDREKVIAVHPGRADDWRDWLVVHPIVWDAIEWASQSFYWVAPFVVREVTGNPFRPVTLPVGEVCGKCKGFGKVILRYYRQRDVPPDSRNCDTCHGTGHGPSPVLTPLVKSLAEAAYQERQEDGTLDLFRLGLLSDALEEAGLPTDETCCRCGGTGSLGGDRKIPASRTKLCDACGGRLQSPHPLLAHLREPGPHYRGCFAIDLLTGRG